MMLQFIHSIINSVNKQFCERIKFSSHAIFLPQSAREDYVVLYTDDDERNLMDYRTHTCVLFLDETFTLIPGECYSVHVVFVKL